MSTGTHLRLEQSVWFTSGPECYRHMLGKSKVLRVSHFSRHSPDEEVSVEVEAVCATRALALDVRLIIHTEHCVASVASHHQLMPAALFDLYFADECACS